MAQSTPPTAREAQSPPGEAPALTVQLENAYERIGVRGVHRQVVFMVLLGVFFDVLEQNAIGVTGPVLQEYWGLGAGDIGFLNTITFTATAVGRVVTGILSDRYGRRTMLTANLLIFSLGALICALAPSYGVLALGRGIVGFGLGGEIAVAVVMISEFFSARNRGTAVGFINILGGGLGNMLAPAFGIMVFALFPGPERWRWVFGLLVLPALLVIFYRFFTPETPRYLLSRGRVEEAEKVLDRLHHGRLLGKAPQAGPWFTASEGDQLQAERRPRLREIVSGRLRRRTISLGVAVCMTYGAQITVLTLIPTILTTQGYSITESLWFTLVMQSGSLVGAVTASLAARRLPRKLVLTVGAVLGVVFGLCFGFLTSHIALVLLFGALFNFCVVLLNTSIWIYAPELYPTRLRGFGTAVILALGSLAGGLMPLAAGRLFDAAGIGAMFTLMAGLYVVFAIAVQFPPETFDRPMEED
ncbi:MFS transporter [Pseudactinotalea sp. HY160]|uniref:MFS transporter n=1 Tax=Pseudactinotalea sp. HY160 TaxID=2654490 RepID=UPI00128BA6CC|nr:MFS transporter [Pseudactinotalea sp. HY160]MPV50398.1 MFS transporter [Pseudactinotalea sp. HY160]